MIAKLTITTIRIDCIIIVSLKAAGELFQNTESNERTIQNKILNTINKIIDRRKNSGAPMKPDTPKWQLSQTASN